MPSTYNQQVGGGDPGVVVGGNTRKTFATTQFGTRKLSHIIVDAIDDLETNHTNSDSNLSKVLYALQQQVEVYGVGHPNGSRVTVIIADDTAPYDDGDAMEDYGRNSRLETALSTAGISADVWNAKLEGDNLNWD